MCSFCPLSKSNKKPKNFFLILLFKKNIPKWGNGNKLIKCRVNEVHEWEKYPRLGDPSSTTPSS
jgi:hypothetical protein